jgi:hypothetical protein
VRRLLPIAELASLDGLIRKRLRSVVWVQWKTRGNRYRELRRLKVTERVASAAADWFFVERITHVKGRLARISHTDE